MDFACDIDLGSSLSVGKFGQFLGRPLMSGSVSPVSDVPGFTAGIHSRVARPSGPGGLVVYKCWSRERDVISVSAGDRITPLHTPCSPWNCVVGAVHAAWTSAVDYSC